MQRLLLNPRGYCKNIENLVMKDYLKYLRNIGFIAHIDAGKTTTTERILFYTGRIRRPGEVDEGTATTDWMLQEKERGITITSASTRCHWKDSQINIIDTPGHVDFTVEVERSLKVLDAAVVIFSGVEGVESQSETVWRQADKYKIPRICFINKMDRVGSDVFSVLSQIRNHLGVEASLLQIPIGEFQDFQGLIELLEMRAIFWEEEDRGFNPRIGDIPEEYKDKALHYRDELISHLAELDHQILEYYVHNKPLDKEFLKSRIRELVIGNRFFPVLCGSALKYKGIQPLLDAIRDFFPSPLDLPPIRGFNPRTREFEEIPQDTDAPFCGLCFKIFTDPYVGRLSYVRLYSGRLKPQDVIYNSSRREKEKITKIVRMHANTQEALNEVLAGDIVALVGLKSTRTGDTLCEEKFPIVLESIKFPEPVISMSIEPKSKQDQDRLGLALNKLQDEDPSFRVEYNSETGQTLICGMGELHLEVTVDRMLREFNVEANLGRPQVAYKETITKNVPSCVGKFIRQTGGKGQYGHVVLRLEPGERGEGIVFENRIKQGLIPKEFIPSIEEGVREAAKTGVVLGFPLIDMRIFLIDGSYHEVDSSDYAFRIASNIALKEGVLKGKPVILEPIMNMEILVPEAYLSLVVADLNSRRAKIEALFERHNVKGIRCFVPLREVFNYANILRSITQGRGVYTMEPAYYAIVPEELRAKIWEGR